MPGSRKRAGVGRSGKSPQFGTTPRRLDAELVGRASVALGAGRDRVADPVDPAVGIMVNAKPGDKVSAGDSLLDVFYRDDDRLGRALELLARAIVIGDEPPATRPLIVGEVR